MNVKVPCTVRWADYSPPDFTAPLCSHRSLGRFSTGQQRFQDEKIGGFIPMNVNVPDQCLGLTTRRRISLPPWFSPQPGKIFHWTAKISG